MGAAEKAWQQLLAVLESGRGPNIESSQTVGESELTISAQIALISFSWEKHEFLKRMCFYPVYLSAVLVVRQKVEKD